MTYFWLFLVEGPADIESAIVHGTLAECIQAQRETEKNPWHCFGYGPQIKPRRFSIRRTIERRANGQNEKNTVVGHTS